MTAAPPSTIRILLVDDHAVVRAGIRALLEEDEGFEIAGEAANVAEALAALHQHSPDIVLLDVRLPDGSGLEVCREVQTADLPTRVIILSAFADDEVIMSAVQAGADGYLLKEIDSPTLARSIRTVAAGNSILDPMVTRRVLGRIKSISSLPQSTRLEALSPQELRVLEFVARGKTNKEIGLSMGLSDKTVKNYLRNLMEKLKVSRRSEAAAFYAQHVK